MWRLPADETRGIGARRTDRIMDCLLAKIAQIPTCPCGALGARGKQARKREKEAS
jgi:hypothetical protein